MKEAGDVSLEDVVEVVVRVSDVVEGVHSREGVILVEGGEGDQSAVVWESSTFLIPIFVLADPQAAGSGDRGSCPPGFLRTSQKEDNEEAGFAWWSSEVWTSDPRVLCLYAKEFRKEERAKKGKRKVTATTTSADDAGPPPLPSKPAKRAGKTGPKT